MTPHIQTDVIKDSFIKLGDSLQNRQKIKPALDALGKAITDAIKRPVTANLVHTKTKDDFFGMSVTPDKSTVDKISKIVINSESNLDAIKLLWEKASSWRLDIDDTLFQFLNAEELTAITLHEIGHIIDTDAVPTRLYNIVQFGIATNPVMQRAMTVSKNLFSKFVRIPVSLSCQMSYDKSGIRKEIKADTVAAVNGYRDALVSGMSKLESYLGKNQATTATDDEIKGSVMFVNEKLQQISDRKLALAKQDLNHFRLHLESADTYDGSEDSAFFEAVNDCCECMNFKNVTDGEYFEELALFSKKLEPIDRNQLDYIRLKIEGMENMTDKMVIVSYINSKLELAEYYLSILHDKKASKKYKVPHTEEYLAYVIETLNTLRDKALAKKIGQNNYYDIKVTYPTGYEG